jgi:hypothetical protein
MTEPKPERIAARLEIEADRRGVRLGELCHDLLSVIRGGRPRAGSAGCDGLYTAGGAGRGG